MSVIFPIVAHRGYSSAPNMEAPVEAAPLRVESWMKDAPLAALKPVRMVNANQLTSLSAMIAYAALRSGQSEFRIERSLSDRFNIPNAKCLPANQFDIAIRYLVDTL
ncbi:MAG: hypothetical protein P4M15_08315 [Alphaproteobacteria bacterium]|nr:hypothetical protein [Alphaproteobacteria bacterium]